MQVREEEEKVVDLLYKLALQSQDFLKEALADGISFVENSGNGIGTKLFESLFNLVPQSCVEAVVVDHMSQPSKVLITKRSDNDPTYPNRWHCPGTYIRLGESSKDALRRCVSRELGVGVEASEFITAYNNPLGCDITEGLNEKDFRHTVGLVHFVEISGEPTRGTYRWVDFIPCDILETHKDFLAEILGWQRNTNMKSAGN